jgi:hypothetical protein
MYAFLILAAAVAVLTLLAAAALFWFAGLGRPDDAVALPHRPDVGHAAARRAVVAAPPARDPVIGTDIYTADRDARVRAFQQRETANNHPRWSRGL